MTHYHHPSWTDNGSFRAALDDVIGSVMPALHLVVGAPAPTELEFRGSDAPAPAYGRSRPSGIRPLILLGFLPASEPGAGVQIHSAHLRKGAVTEPVGSSLVHYSGPPSATTHQWPWRKPQRATSPAMLERRRFPPPWSLEDPRPQAATAVLHRRAMAKGQALAYAYFEEEPGRRAAAKLITRDEARRIAAVIAKLSELMRGSPQLSEA